jgi:hypothetical protein
MQFPEAPLRVRLTSNCQNRSRASTACRLKQGTCDREKARGLILGPPQKKPKWQSPVPSFWQPKCPHPPLRQFSALLPTVRILLWQNWRTVRLKYLRAVFDPKRPMYLTTVVKHLALDSSRLARVNCTTVVFLILVDGATAGRMRLNSLFANARRTEAV